MYSGFAEDSYFLGLGGGLSYVMNKSVIPIYEGESPCGQFTDGNSIAYHFDLRGGYYFMGKLIYPEIRLIYESRPALLEAETQCSEVFNSITGLYDPLIRNHTFDASLGYISLSLGVSSMPLENIPLGLHLAFEAGNPIISSEYTNSERIKSPDYAYYPGDKKEITSSSGSLSAAGTSLGASIGIFGKFDLDDKWSLIPEVSYRHPINSTVSDNDWNQYVYRATLGIIYTFKDEEIKSSQERKMNKPEEKEPAVEAYNADFQFSLSPLKFTETVVTQTYPILPYIFFDSASAEIKPKYTFNDPTNDFSELKLPKETLEIYYHILDIIGKRMADNKSSTITITGTTDGIELPDKTARLDLAKARAENIKKYLTTRWKLPASRINTGAREIPELPTSNRYNEGFAENRRVEISSNDPQILLPVIHKNFKEYSPNDSSTYLSIISKNLDKPSDFKLEVSDDNNILFTKNWKTLPDDGTLVIPETDLAKISSALKYSNHLIAKISYNDRGERHSAFGKLNIVASKNQFELGRLNLIVFDFDKAEINSTNKIMIEDFVKSGIKNNSIVNIYGSTDRLGEKQYNKKLSQDRANTVKSYITGNISGAKFDKVEGMGDSKLLYDNALPEGRFYCRTVLIEVKTPIGK